MKESKRTRQMHSHLRKCPVGFYGLGMVKRVGEESRKALHSKSIAKLPRGGSQWIEILHCLIIARRIVIQDGQALKI